jgi:hypothetical protein
MHTHVNHGTYPKDLYYHKMVNIYIYIYISLLYMSYNFLINIDKLRVPLIVV